MSDEPKSYDHLIQDIKNENREPTRQEYQLLGTMIMSEKWFNFKERMKKILRIGGENKNG